MGMKASEALSVIESMLSQRKALERAEDVLTVLRNAENRTSELGKEISGLEATRDGLQAKGKALAGEQTKAVKASKVRLDKLEVDYALRQKETLEDFKTQTGVLRGKLKALGEKHEKVVADHRALVTAMEAERQGIDAKIVKANAAFEALRRQVPSLV